jgi:hypothetical protein
MRIKGLLEMMFDVLSGWIAEFIADMEARPFSGQRVRAGCLAERGGLVPPKRVGRRATLSVGRGADCARMWVRCGWAGARAWQGCSARRCRSCDESRRPRFCPRCHAGILHAKRATPAAGTCSRDMSYLLQAVRCIRAARASQAAAARLRQQAGARADSHALQRLEAAWVSFPKPYTNPPPPDASASCSRRRWRTPRACPPPRRRPPRARAPRSAAAARRRPPPRSRPGRAPAPQVPGRPGAVRAGGLQCLPAGLRGCCRRGDAGFATFHMNGSRRLSQRPCLQHPVHGARGTCSAWAPPGARRNPSSPRGELLTTAKIRSLGREAAANELICERLNHWKAVMRERGAPRPPPCASLRSCDTRARPCLPHCASAGPRLAHAHAKCHVAPWQACCEGGLIAGGYDCTCKRCPVPRRAWCERASAAAQGRSCSARWRTGRRSAAGRPARRMVPHRPASPRASWTARTQSWTRTSSRRGPPRARSGPGPPGPLASFLLACMPPRVRLLLLEVVVRQLLHMWAGGWRRNLPFKPTRRCGWSTCCGGCARCRTRRPPRGPRGCCRTSGSPAPSRPAGAPAPRRQAHAQRRQAAARAAAAQAAALHARWSCV